MGSNIFELNGLRLNSKRTQASHYHAQRSKK